MLPYLFDDGVGFSYAFSQVHRLVSQPVVGDALHPSGISFVRHGGHHVVRSLSRRLNQQQDPVTYVLISKRGKGHLEVPFFPIELGASPHVETGLDQWQLRLYLDGPHHAVGELQSGHRSGGAEGRGAALESAHDPTVLAVLLDGQPDQVSEALN